MDRLIIESTLADVNEILFSIAEGTRSNAAIILAFKTINADQIIHAFSALKEVMGKSNLDLVLCKTMMSGIYDLEIKTTGLDEPIRITNKVIDYEILTAIKNCIDKEQQIVLGINVSEEENWITLQTVRIRDCERGD